MSYTDVFNERQQFAIRGIKLSGTGSVPSEIEPEYTEPAISISTGGRFVKHEIIGGATVRQRVGDKPIEVSISGACFESTAKDLAKLRNAEFGTLFSNALPNDSLKVHIVSVSTDPMTDGGAAPIHGENGSQPELLYTYSLECVEIVDKKNITSDSELDTNISGGDNVTGGDLV